MIDHDDLEQSSAIGVSATIVFFLTMITVYNIRTHRTNLKYSDAQKLSFVVFLFPVFIAWQAWMEIFFDANLREVDLVINILKALCICSFYLYIEKMLGRVEKNEKIEFSEEKVYQVLCSDKVSRNFRCFKFPYILTIDNAKKYLQQMKIMIFQTFVVAMTITTIGAIVLLTVNDSSTQDIIFIAILSSRFISVGFVVYAITFFGYYVDRLPEMTGLNIFEKVKIMRLLILFTELQYPVLQLFAALDLIASTEKYSTEEIVNYTFSLILCTEMIIVTVLFVFAFPVSDYDKAVDLKSKMPLLHEPTVPQKIE